jgi:hypothetical protein
MPAFLAMPWPADASQPAIDLPPGQQFWTQRATFEIDGHLHRFARWD